MIRVARSLAVVFLAPAALAACMGIAEPTDDEIATLPLTQVSSGSVTATLTVQASASSYTASVTVRNGGSTATSAWSVAMALGSATVTNSWSVVFSGSTGNVTARNLSEDWNRVIQPGNSISFGWNANGTVRPELTSMSAAVGSTGGAGTTGSAGAGGSAGTSARGGTTGSGGATGSAGTTGTGNTSGGVTAPPPASGSGSTCDRFGQIGAGSYFAQNNVWNSAAGSQCISLSGTALTVTSANHNLNPNQAPFAPASYPSFVRGCHYGHCTDTFPRQVSQIPRMPSTFSIARASGTWDAAYDIWLDPTARRDGANTGLEIMIWIDYSGTPVPIGSRVGSVTLAGSSWEVWLSNGNENGSSRTISYRRGQNNTALTNFDAMAFLNDAVSRGVAQRSWYVTSVQAGFEIWNGGTNLRVSSFSVGAQ